VTDCRDVRARACAIGLSIYTGNTWLQLAEPSGARLVSGYSHPQLPTLLVTNPAVVGYNAAASGPPCFGGNHTYIDATPVFNGISGTMIVAGRTSDFIRGGQDYGGCVYAYGAPGVAFNGASLRVSEVSIVSTIPGNSSGVSSNVPVEVPLRADPTLRLIGTPQPGAAVTVAVDGEPGDVVRLEIGRGPANVVSPGSPVPRLVTPGRLIPLGTVPINGTIAVPLTIPGAALPGDIYWLQGSAVDPLGSGRRTNSLAIVVRE
jgi:hypothetical protein